MEIELINKKPFVFRVGNREYKFVKPYYLMPADDLKLIKGVVKGSTLCWNLPGGVLTYNQIKNINYEKEI